MHKTNSTSAISSANPGSVIKLLFAILFTAGIIGLSACNTVRGVGRDISSMADALDPNEQ
ncbi:MAG: hypothetical protein AB8C13_09855 [Phycisphaerales bacterium]